MVSRVYLDYVHRDIYLGMLPLLWCEATAQAGLWFLLQQQRKGMCLGLKQIPWGEWISGLLRFVHPFSSQFPYLSHLSFCWLFHFLITLFLEKGGRERKYSIQPVSTDFHFHSAYDNGQARLLLGVSTTDKIFALFVQLEQI